MTARPDHPGRLKPEAMYPAGLAHLTAQRVTIRTGESLRVIEGGPAGAPPVVLLHGWGGSVYSFAETIESLIAAGHRIVAIDLPGHGLSDPFTNPARYNIASLADAILDVIAARGLSAYALMAHSMGGAVALEIARRPGGVRRLVLVSSVGVGHVRWIGLLRAFSPRFLMPLIQSLLGRASVHLILRFFAFASADRPTERDIDEYWAPTQFSHFAHATRQCIHHMEWSQSALAVVRAIRMPVLVLAGGRDRVVRDVARAGCAIAGVRVVEFRDAGHLVMQERAAECAAELTSFLTSGG